MEKVKAVSEEVVEVEVEEHSSAMPFLISDFMHNFTDGIAVGAAYAVSKTKCGKVEIVCI